MAFSSSGRYPALGADEIKGNDVMKPFVMHKSFPQPETYGGKGDPQAVQPLQAPRCPDPEQPPHHQTQIVRGDLHQVPLRGLLEPIQPSPPATPGFAHVRETPFDSFAPQSLQGFAALATHTSPIGSVRLLMCLGLVRPSVIVRLFALRN